MLKIVIFLILIAILILLNYNINENMVNENLINQDIWLNYRLGDIITGQCYKKPYERDYFNSIGILFPNSIAAEYNEKTKYLKDKRFGNINILNDIIKNKTDKFDIPDKNSVVIHLRIGDSLLDYKNGKFIYNERKRFKSGTYAIKIESFQTIIDNIKKKFTNFNNKIILVFGSHKTQNKKLNNIYLKQIENILKKNNIKVQKRFTGNPDKDFIFMSNSKYFVKSNGIYSDLVSKIVEKNGGVIIDSNKF